MITRCTPLFQRQSQVELKCKLAIRRSDNNYSLNGLFFKLKTVFTHIYKYMVSQRVQVIHTGSHILGKYQHYQRPFENQQSEYS